MAVRKPPERTFPVESIMPAPSGSGPRRTPRPRSWKVASLSQPGPALPPVQTAAERARSQAAEASYVDTLRGRKGSARLGDCLIYPLADGPGVALLLVFPLFLWVMSAPVFDVIAAVAPQGEFNALVLLILPFTLPLVSSFVMALGYVFLFLGHVLVASALGEDDHPSWPEWDTMHILEGLGRLLWAGLVGLAIGGVPLLIYWINCGDVDLVDQIIFAELVAVGAAYAQMALVAALVHESIWAANPVTVIKAIVRIGWAYWYPCLVMGFTVVFAAGALYGVLFHSPSVGAAGFGLWLFWVLALYGGMVVMRVLGLTYYRHAHKLGWFRARPRWASTTRVGKIYANS